MEGYKYYTYTPNRFDEYMNRLTVAGYDMHMLTPNVCSFSKDNVVITFGAHINIEYRIPGDIRLLCSTYSMFINRHLSESDIMELAETLSADCKYGELEMRIENKVNFAVLERL